MTGLEPCRLAPRPRQGADATSADFAYHSAMAALVHTMAPGLAARE